MNQYQQNLAIVAAARLDPSDPGFNGSDEVAKALRDPDLRNFLDCWVLPLVNHLATGVKGERFPRDRQNIRDRAFDIEHLRRLAKRGMPHDLEK